MKASRPGSTLVLVALLFAAAFPQVSSAATVKTGTDVNLAGPDALAGNVYVAAGRANISQAVSGDLVVVSAADANISGGVAGDLTVLGYQAVVSGKIDGDLRVVGGLVTVSGTIGGDLVIAGGRVLVAPGATIGGDLLVAGGELVTRGAIDGAIDVIAGSAGIGGRQNGGTVTAPTVTFLADATGSGLSYYAQNPATVEPGAALGPLSYNQIPPISEIGPVKRGLLSFLTLWRFFSFASTLVLGLALVYGAKVFTQEMAVAGSRRLRSFFASVAIGVATFLLLPLVSLLAVASIFALPLGILGLLGAAALVVLASAAGALVVGLALERAFRRGADCVVSYRAVAFGAVAVELLGLLPGGSLIKVAVAFAGVGAATRVVARRLRGDGWSIEKVLARWGGGGAK